MLVQARIRDPSAGWVSHPLSLLVDTGASTSCLFEDAVASRVSRIDQWPRLEDVAVTTVLGRFREDVILLPVLELVGASAPLRVDRVEAGVGARRSLPDIAAELPVDMHGLLGNSFLRRFRLALDYANQVIWLDPTAAPSEHDSRLAGVGLTIEHRWGEVRVVGVEAESPAAEAGVVYGDVIVSIDGVATRDLADSVVEERLRGPAGSDVVLIVRRGGVQRVLRLMRESPR